MFRLSRIHAPRATLAALVLVTAVLLAFGLVADAHVAESSVVVLPADGGSDWPVALLACLAVVPW